MESTADRYGRSFADVYDSWYRDDASAPGFDAAAVCAAIDGLTRGAADILEVGVGTGRLAIPLALAGHRVVGLDSSRDMLVRLEENIDRLGTGTGSVRAVLGDASATLPPDRVDAVLGAFNLIVNLPGRSAQAAFVAAAAQRLAPGGVVILDAYLPDDATEHRRDLVTRSVDPVALERERMDHMGRVPRRLPARTSSSAMDRCASDRGGSARSRWRRSTRWRPTPGSRWHTGGRTTGAHPSTLRARGPSRSMSALPIAGVEPVDVTYSCCHPDRGSAL